MNQPPLTPEAEEFQAWLSHPVTKLFRQWVKGDIERLKDAWANGAFTGAFSTEMMVKNAAATGAVSALKSILELSVDDLYGAENE